MYISKVTAQEIVEEIGQEIQENINLMDQNGFIVASTDSARIGQLHEGALRVISEELPELYITEEMETDSMRKGINLPLIVLGSVIGVVGITGTPEQVSRYGKIVKRMTEIMLTDSIRKNTKRYGHWVSYRFLEEWIEASTIPVYEKHFVDRGMRLGIDITRKYRILSLTFPEYPELSSSLEGQELLESMEATIRHQASRNNYIYLNTPPNQLLFIPVCSNEQLKQIYKQYASMVSAKYRKTLIAGYDSDYGQHQNMKQARKESLAALQYTLRTGRNIASYDSLGIHFLLQELPASAKVEYMEHFCAGIPEDKMDECLQLISNYFKYDGSLQKMSEAMFLHKNTLQYKLKKLDEYTGLDIRNTTGCAAYYVFLLICQEMQTE